MNVNMTPPPHPYVHRRIMPMYECDNSAVAQGAPPPGREEYSVKMASNHESLKWNIKQQNKVEVLKSTALQCAIIRRTYTTFMLSCQMLLLSHARFEHKV